MRCFNEGSAMTKVTLKTISLAAVCGRELEAVAAIQCERRKPGLQFWQQEQTEREGLVGFWYLAT